MGLIIVCAAFTAIFGFGIYICDEYLWDKKFSEILMGTSLVGTTCCAIALGIMILVAIVNNVGYNGFVAQNQAIYDSLVYQLENDLYDNDNDLGKKELYNQIQEWNKDLSEGKAMTHDPWLGIFWIDAYDEFEFIELE